MQRPHDLLIHSALHHQMMDDHRLLLPLPPEAGVGLLIQLQRPVQPKPHNGAAAVLQVQAVPGGGWLGDGDGDFSRVPVLQISGGFQFPHTVGILRAVFSEALLNARKIVLIGVHHQHRLSVRRFNEILQRIQLFIVNHADVVKLIVHRAVGKLQQLARQRRRVQRQHVAVRVGKQHVPFHLPVQIFFPR